MSYLLIKDLDEPNFFVTDKSEWEKIKKAARFAFDNKFEFEEDAFPKTYQRWNERLYVMEISDVVYESLISTIAHCRYFGENAEKLLSGAEFLKFAAKKKYKE